MCETRAHKTVNAFAVCAKRVRSACNKRLLYTLRQVGTVQRNVEWKQLGTQNDPFAKMKRLCYIVVYCIYTCTQVVTKTQTGPDHTDRIYAIYFTDHGPSFSKNLPFPFHRRDDLVSSPDAHLITDAVPCPEPKKLGCKISNPKYESLIVNPISLHVGFVFGVMDPTSRFWGLGKGTVSMLNPFILV